MNGDYAPEGFADGVQCWAHSGGKLLLLRYAMSSGTRFWYITARRPNLMNPEGDYYRIKSDSDSPPTGLPWNLDKCPCGVHPAPTLEAIYVPEAQLQPHTRAGARPECAVTTRAMTLWGGSPDFELCESPWVISCVLGWIWAYQGRKIIPCVCTTMKALVAERDFEWRRPPHRLVVLGKCWTRSEGYEECISGEMLDPGSLEWAGVKGMPVEHDNGLEAVTVDGCVWVIGGGTEAVTMLTSEGDWVSMSPMHKKRTHFSAVVHLGFIYAIGGNKDSDVER